MFSLSSLLIASAYAADDAAPVMESASSELMRFLPLFLIFGVIYFFMIRPQQKKLDEQVTFLKGLNKGDKIVTSGGMIGTIVKLDSDEIVTIEVAEGIQVKVIRATISSHHKEK